MKIELFNEFYGCYFNTIYHILREAAERELTDSEFRNLIRNKSETYGFPTTTCFVVENAIKKGTNEEIEENKDAWPLFDRVKRGKTAEVLNVSRLKNITDLPLSTVEKMWLKSIFNDPRIKLFLEEGVSLPELDDVEPLFDWEDIEFFDQYGDGDPFQDQHYVDVFRQILRAVHHHRPLEIEYRKSHKKLGNEPTDECNCLTDTETGVMYIETDHIEYSERDDKFRLIGENPGYGRNFINISSVIRCREVEKSVLQSMYKLDEERQPAHQKEVVFEIYDKNNALERFLINFSHYDKETEFVKDEGLHRVKLIYDETDEKDLVIRTLSFGPNVRVVQPDYFVQLLQEKLRMQMNLMR